MTSNLIWDDEGNDVTMDALTDVVEAMTEPLIDRDTLAQAFYMDRALTTETLTDCEALTDAVLAYLRSVLTPEALRTYFLSDGEVMHRRIFGEDQ